MTMMSSYFSQATVVLVVLSVCGTACSSKSDSGTPGPTDTDFRETGPRGVVAVPYPATELYPPFTVWGPGTYTAATHTLADLELDAGRASLMTDWVAAAPAGCPTTSLEGEVGSPITGQDLPVVVLSHCYACSASSLATIAGHLASWGVVVAAVSHEGNTLFDAHAGEGLPLDTGTLAIRVDQLDALIEHGLPATGISLDLSRVMSLGHSFGVVTTGMVAQRSGALAGSVFLGAPADNPLLSGVEAEALDLPTVWVLLEEDNSIGSIGNQLIEDNADTVPGDTRLVRMPDAGHWSVSDIVGVAESTMPGCGEDTRQDGSGDTFTYPDPSTERQTTAAVVAAALVPWLRGDVNFDAVDALDGWNGLVVEER
jgi:dienelactone hydrolase